LAVAISRQGDAAAPLRLGARIRGPRRRRFVAPCDPQLRL